MLPYNTTTYSVTQYHKEGVSEAENSDVIQKTVNGDIYAATDSIAVTNNDIQNIDAGFTENQIFDLSINKTIDKVTVTNGLGTKETKDNNTKLAKVDIHAKQLANSVVTVQYNFNITNEGELPGYVNEIVDYMPNDLQFIKEANSDWHLGEDGKLHNMSLSKTLIQPGETKQLTLNLTKHMTVELVQILRK